MLAVSRTVSVVRTQVMARIKASPTLKRDHWRANGGWQAIGLLAFGLLVMVTLVPVLLLALPFLAGTSIVQRADDPGFRKGIELLVAALSMAVSIGHAGWLMRELTASRSVAIFSHLPISDAIFLRNRCRYSLLLTLTFLIPCTAFSAGVWYASKLTPADSWIVFGLGLSTWLTVVAFSLIVPGWIPRLSQPTGIAGIVGSAILAVVLGAISGVMKLVPFNAVAGTALLLLPTGWPILMVEEVVFRNDSRVWWLLIPMSISIVAAWFAWRRMSDRYVIHEIEHVDGGIGEVVLQRPNAGVEVDFEPENADKARSAIQIELDESPSITARFRRWIVGDRPQELPTELTEAEAADKVRSCDFLTAFDWEKCGPIERFVGMLLNDRERCLAELLVAGDPAWSWRAALVLGGCSAASMFVFVVDQQFNTNLLGVVTIFIGIYIGVGFMERSWPACVWKARSGHSCSLTGFLPVNHADLNRIAMVLGAVRSAVIFPFVTGLALLTFYDLTGRIELLQSVYIGLKGSLIVVALHLTCFFDLLPYALTTGLVSRFLSFLGRLAVLLVIIAACFGLFIAGESEIQSLIASAVIFGGGWVARRNHHRRLLRHATDLVVLRQNELQQSRPVQQDGFSW